MNTIYKALTLIFLLTGYSANAQWTARAGLGQNNTRTFSTSFSINGRIYLVGGNFNFSGLEDVWEYNPTTDTWAQKADFPGGIRGSAVAFVIGNSAYYMSGADYNGQFFNDVWEYNAVTDTWTQKADAPFFERYEAIGFAIGNRGYFGTGYTENAGPNSTTWNTFSDFWEYNPANDTWTQKADVPGPTRGWAVAGVAGSMGYVGLGGNEDQDMSFNDFYEYDPALNTWTAKTNYPLMLSDAASFSWNGEVYVCGGIDFTTLTPTNTFRKYMPATNTWSTLPSFSGGVIMGPASATVANRAFLGTGYDGSLTERQDWWEFVIPTVTVCPGPITFNSSTVAVTAAQPCSGKVMLSGIVNACSPFTVSILPASGTVQTGAGSATITGLCAGTYTVKVSDNNCCGSAQKIVVVPAAPLATGITETPGEEALLTVFPNPNAGTFSLSGKGAISKNNLSLYNVVGQRVNFTIHEHKDQWEIEMDQPVKGIYFLSYRHGANSFISKVIIQ